ncbi:hypothetical protein [Christiangramia antarctica]|uniref:hypothetical protein n=1 Tax=Christiangramia antarctica TaxID=2058158 RepID=UPI003672E4E3
MKLEGISRFILTISLYDGKGNLLKWIEEQNLVIRGRSKSDERFCETYHKRFSLEGGDPDHTGRNCSTYARNRFGFRELQATEGEFKFN